MPRGQGKGRTSCQPQPIHPVTESRQSPFVSRVPPPQPFTLVLFGATGDLAGRKLFPALMRLFQGQHLRQQLMIVAIGRRDMSEQDFRAAVRKKLTESSKDEESADTDRFLSHVFYQRADIATSDGMKGLARRVPDLERER